MKAFVFKSSNALIGKFDVMSTAQVAEGLTEFEKTHALSSYDYIECSGMTWTLVSGANGLELMEGRQYPASGWAPVTDAPCDGASRYSDAYATADSIVMIGSIIKGIGIVIGAILVAVGLIAASAFNGVGGGVTIVASLISGLFNGIMVYVIGVLISALGHILKANLDSAVHSSPFLTDEQRAAVMRLKP